MVRAWSPIPCRALKGERTTVQYTAAMPSDVAAEVISNTPLSNDYNVLALAAPTIAEAASPGQFVMLKVAKGHDPLLRRPFSLFETISNGSGASVGFSILNKRIGASTSRLYDARPGDTVACLGPLGRGFTLIAPPAEAWMVAGGVGLAPFATLAKALVGAGISTTLFYGARRAEELFYVDWFSGLGVTMVLTTEDGSRGERGRVIAPLERALATRAAALPVTLYSCGPEGMLAATARVAARFNRPCQVSVERTMGCGMGGCYSCVVPMRDDEGHRHHVRSCLAGPVLDAARIDWD